MMNTNYRLDQINQKEFKELSQLTSSLNRNTNILTREDIPIYQLMMQFYVRKPITIFEDPYAAIDNTKFSMKTNKDYDYVLIPINQKNTFGIYENEDPYLIGRYYSIYESKSVYSLNAINR
jgi:hypothetical protein